MRCIVTGGAGFIGNNIVKKLVARGDDVTVIDNLNTGKEENLKSVIDKITFLKDSILNRELLEKQSQNIDGIFHQAALASVQDSFSKPDEYHDVNVNGTENILKLAKKNDFRVVMQVHQVFMAIQKEFLLKNQIRRILSIHMLKLN